jgi:anaerobic selenocysteine-containing dehydrogenase
MTKIVWKDFAELDSAAKAGDDEFGPEVAQALAHLRTANGLDDATSVELPSRIHGDADRFREEIGTALPGVNRRGFLQLTGAAAVFAMAGCWHKDPEVLVPYAQQPEGSTIGKPVYWSSIVRDSGRAVPVMVKTYDGRPIKVDGNPDSPLNSGKRVHGASDLATQACLLNLYDPDRQIRGPQRKQAGKLADITWDALDADVAGLLKTGKVALITGAIDGPARRAVVDGFQKAFGDRVRHVAYEPFAADRAAEARRWCFGKDQAKPPVHHLEKADVLVTLGSDFLGGGHATLADHVAFGDFRQLRGTGEDANLGQVIAFEPTMSQTGTVADIRVRASMDKIERLAWGLAKALGAEVPDTLNPATGQQLGLTPIDNIDAVTWVAKRLQEVKAAGRHSLVYVGGAVHMGARSKSLYVAANLINHLLGNEGVTVETASVGDSVIWGDAIATGELMAEIAAGEYPVVILAGANVAATVPGAAAALAAAKAVIVLADRADESFAAASTAYLAPSLHDLESWGDAEPRAGVYALQQPIIAPLWDCRGVEDSLMAFAVATLGDAAPEAFRVEIAPANAKLVTVCSRQMLWQGVAKGVRPFADLVRSIWTTTVHGASKSIATADAFWTAVRQTGIATAEVAAPAAVNFNSVAIQALTPTTVSGTFHLVINASRTMGDGRGANNAWLNEVPDPVSRITWDNYLSV